jgi:hypothetical protein
LEPRARLQTHIPQFMRHVPKTLLRPTRAEPGDPLGDVLTSGGLHAGSCMALALSTLPFLIRDPVIKARRLISTGIFEACAICACSKGALVVPWLVHAAEAALREDAATGGLSEWERLVLQCFSTFATCYLCPALDECLAAFEAAHQAVAAAAAPRGLKSGEARAAGLRSCAEILDLSAAILAVQDDVARVDLLLQHGPLSSSVQFERLYQVMLNPGKSGKLLNILVRGTTCMSS